MKLITKEPREGSVVLDGDLDAWQRRSNRWHSTFSDEDLTDYSWDRLTAEFAPIYLAYEAGYNLPED
jgi:hypothetical protein